MTSHIEVHVIDDDLAIRGSLTFVLEGSGLSIRTYSSAREFLAVAAEISEGCVVTDIRMPEMSGLELIAELKARGSKLPVIVITAHGDVQAAVAAMKNGVLDFLEKPFDDEVLVAAIRRALKAQAGEVERVGAVGRFAILLADLSPREVEVLRGVVAGKANKTIAYELDISSRTVEVYRGKVYGKTGAQSLSELVRMATLAGF
jgi:two-component system response regulator FixJ